MATFTSLTINDTGSLKPATGTTAQRPGSTATGQIRFNTTLQQVELYDSGTGTFVASNRKYENLYLTDCVCFLDAGNRASYPGTGTTWYDLTGRGNNATLSDSWSFSREFGGSIQFTTSDGRAQVASTSDFAFGTGDLTWEVWIRTESVGSYIHMIAFPDQSTLALKSNVTTAENYVYSPAWTTSGNTPGWNLGRDEWTHVVVTRASGTAYVYINGLYIGSYGGWSGSYTAQIMNISRGYPNEYTDKKIAIVRVFKGRALTTAQIQQNYDASMGRFGHDKWKKQIPTSGLRTFFDFSNRTCAGGYGSDFINDLSPLYNKTLTTGNNGVLFGSTKPSWSQGTGRYHGSYYNSAADGTLALRQIQSFDYFTAVVWFRWNGDSNTEDILWNNESTWEVNTNGGVVNWAVYANNQSWFWYDSTGRLKQNYPNFVGQTYDGTYVRTYVNGYKVQTYTYPGNGVLNKPNQYTKFWERGGGFSYQDQSDSIHTIYEIYVYDRAIDETEMQMIYQEGKRRFADGPV